MAKVKTGALIVIEKKTPAIDPTPYSPMRFVKRK